MGDTHKTHKNNNDCIITGIDDNDIKDDNDENDSMDYESNDGDEKILTNNRHSE